MDLSDLLGEEPSHSAPFLEGDHTLSSLFPSNASTPHPAATSSPQAQHDPGLASGSSRTLELALAELLEGDRRDAAAGGASRDDSHELMDDDTATLKRGRARVTKSSKGATTPSRPAHGGVVNGRNRNGTPSLAVPSPLSRESTPKPHSNNDRRSSLQNERPLPSQSNSAGPSHTSHTARLVQTGTYDVYTPNESSEDDEEYESKSKRRGKTRAAREAADKAKIPED